MTMDISRFQAKIAAARAALQAEAAAHVIEAGENLIDATQYADPIPPEERAIGVFDVLTDIEETSTSARIGIRQLFDWVLEEGHQHCTSDDGRDCVSFAAGGPYTLDTIPATPGDGTTPCGSLCFCQVIPREPDLEGAVSDVFATLGAAVGADIANAWGSA